MPQEAWSRKRERQYDHIKDGLRSRGRSEAVGRRTRDQLYEEAKRKNIAGRSTMNKAQLERAVGR